MFGPYVCVGTAEQQAAWAAALASHSITSSDVGEAMAQVSGQQFGRQLKVHGGEWERAIEWASWPEVQQLAAENPPQAGLFSAPSLARARVIGYGLGDLSYKEGQLRFQLMLGDCSLLIPQLLDLGALGTARWVRGGASFILFEREYRVGWHLCHNCKKVKAVTHLPSDTA